MSRRAAPVFLVLLAAWGLAGGMPGQSVPDAFERVHGSVVTVRTEGREGLPGPGVEPAIVRKVGSGVLISSAGRVLTAAHLVQAEDSIVVEFDNGEKRAARVVGSDVRADVALLQVEGRPPRAAAVAPIGDSDRVRIGSEVLVIGAPLGISRTLTVGRISARRKSEAVLGGMRGIEHFQTDAPISQGNSGGPVFNLAGELIGIVCHMVSVGGGNEGLGFAIASNAVSDLLLRRPTFWSGFEAVYLSEDLARIFNTPDGVRGLLVLRVAKDSPAEDLGMRGGFVKASIGGTELLVGGDIILEIQGVRLGGRESSERIAQAIGSIPAGGTLEAVVLRGGRRLGLKAVLRR